jgi:hypothetical protein
MRSLFLMFLSLASFLISPIYVIFDDRRRSAEVTLLNTTKDTNLYRLSWKVSRQKEDGSYEFMEKLPEGMIDPREFVRFSPRQITLPAGARQLIRITLQKPANLPDGEYRLHLQFSRLPDEKSLADEESEEQGVSMLFRVTLGVAMPVVIRHGTYDARVTISEAKFVDRRAEGTVKTPELLVRLDRTGKHGTYGRLRVFWQKDGQNIQIGTLNNMSVFADSSSRVAYIPLNENQISGGQVRIVYEGDGPQRGIIFTEKTLKVGS